MNILLVGGGSGGPVSPLLAVAQEIKKTHHQARLLLVGGKGNRVLFERDLSFKGSVNSPQMLALAVGF